MDIKYWRSKGLVRWHFSHACHFAPVHLSKEGPMTWSYDVALHRPRLASLKGSPTSQDVIHF